MPVNSPKLAATVAALLLAAALAGCGSGGHPSAAGPAGSPAAGPAGSPAAGPAGSPAAGPADSPAASPTMAGPTVVGPSVAAGSPSSTITIAPTDRAACASLFAHLQQVTAALDASAELIASSLSKEELSARIAAEQEQLRQSAELMSQGAVPVPLVAADRQLVAALHALVDDFGRAAGPAARGDFQAAAQAMTDQPVVQRIVDASKTIEDACG
jgi:hypothetical protein